jgi:hypothetical protein
VTPLPLAFCALARSSGGITTVILRAGFIRVEYTSPHASI